MYSNNIKCNFGYTCNDIHDKCTQKTNMHVQYFSLSRIW